MNCRFQHRHLWTALAGLLIVGAAGAAGEQSFLPSMLPFPNATGIAATYSTVGKVDLTGPFFQSLGTNGRACVSCHQPSIGWTVTPENIQARFEATGGTDPIFRTNDGSNSPNADVSTVESRRSAYSMLLSKGLIRIGIGIPAGAEFELAEVDDPHGYASAKELSLFRRPLPTTNLKFLSTFMWDGRETFKDPASTDCVLGTTNCFASLHFDLADQSNTATATHAQAAQPLTTEQREAIVAFETTLFTTQVFDHQAGELTARHALGGPETLSQRDFYFGINDVVSGDYRTGALFNPTVFKLYDAWNTLDPGGADGSRADARRAVARGETLFNSKPIVITGVKGLNDDLSVPVLQGTCTTCHDTPNSGNHSIPAPLDIGLTDTSRRTPDLPLYTLQNKQTGERIQTTDPGRALVTGKWKDIGRFKGPILRALATRAPYFHNGSASDLGAAVDFYNQRFGIGLTDDEKGDLVAFLLTL
jgi:cytochrome c peroxidase